MTPTFNPAPEFSAPRAILTPMALFERQCVLSGVKADARALRVMLHDFFEAGQEAGKREAALPGRRAAHSEAAPPCASDRALATLGEIGFDPLRVKAALERHYAEHGDVDASLREAVRHLIVVRGRPSTEINYKGVVEAYDAAVRVHGK